MKNRIMLFTVVFTLLVGCLVAFAQDQPQVEVKTRTNPKAETEVKIQMTEVKTRGGAMGADTFTFIAAEGAFGGKVVKGVPYSADAVSENIQVLQDGNRISRKNTSAVYRDSEGRIRQEQTLRSIGPYATAGDPPRTIFIFDPVANLHYTLEPHSKMARKMEMPRLERTSEGENMVYSQHNDHIKIRTGLPSEAPQEERIITIDRFPESDSRVEMKTGKPENLKTEALGKQMLEGVEAEGTRTTFTIPAGEIGNEKPINIVTEVWFSTDLQVVVLHKHTDPRQGEMTYRLTNIKRAEPDHSLFEVPADYTIKEMPSPKTKMILEREIVREKVKKNDKNEQ